MTQPHPIDDDVPVASMVYSEGVRLRSHDVVTDVRPEQAEYTHECRCGGMYCITAAELQFGCNIATCAQCSLAIRVIT